MSAAPAVHGVDADLRTRLHRRAVQPPHSEVDDELAAHLAAFRSGDRIALERARQPLAALGPVAIPGLLDLVTDGDGDVAGNALVCLYWLAPDDTFPLVVENLDNERTSFVDFDVLSETVGTVAWVFLHESVDDWPFSDVSRRLSAAQRRALQPRLREWFASIERLEPLPVPPQGWPKVRVVT